MIRQSQHLFAAALSAAALNVAAVAAFVFFTLLSGLQAFPLQSLVGAGETAAAPSSPSAGAPAGSAQPADDFLRGGGVTPSARGGAAAAGGAQGLATQIRAPGSGSGRPSADGVPGGAVAGSGNTSLGTPGASATGPGGLADLPATDLPSAPQGAGAPAPGRPPSVQQLGGTVSDLPPAVNQGANDTVGTADNLLGGGLSQTGASQAVNDASGALLGPGSTVGKTANNVGNTLQGKGGTLKGAGGALKGLGGGN